MKWREAISRMLPWEPRAHRRAAIDAARAEKERSREAAADARAVKRQIERLAEANHFADIIAHDIIHGRRKGGR